MDRLRLLLPLCSLLLLCLGCGTPANNSDGQADAGPGGGGGGGNLPVGATCSATNECASGTVCSLEKCAQPCTAGSCVADTVCQADGRCLPLDMLVGGTDGGCGQETYSATGVTPNMLVLLDYSGSMRNQIGGVPKWTIARNALETTVQSNVSATEVKIRFGVEIFPDRPGDDASGTGSVVLAVGDNGLSTVMGSVPVNLPDATNHTPIANALGVALDSLTQPDGSAGRKPKDSARANYVLLLTDGQESYGDPVAATQALSDAGVRTYVVGFGSGVNPTTLEAMATAGGTARTSSPKYYVADDQSQLVTALGDIARGSLGCDYALGKTPPDPRRLFVFENGIEVRRDVTHADGWDYLPDSNRVVFYGATCDRISQESASSLRIVFGCGLSGPS